MDELNQLWQKCLNIMEEQNIVEDKICFETYFKGANLVAINNNIATLTTLMNFNIDTINTKKNEIEVILSKMTSLPIQLNVVTDEDYKNNHFSNTPKKITNSNLNKQQTFENFIIGSSNKMAQNAATIVSTNPGSNFNPLFLYSNPGLGKTHLLHAIGNYAQNINNNLIVKYITSKEFVAEVIDAIKSRNTDEIYNKYEQVDILLIDDIQFLFGKEKSSEIFFHIFNTIINDNKQIVITSDKKPEELSGIEERLISRFQSGLSFGIDPPEFETAKAIFEKKLESLDNPGLIITEDVVDFIATNYCHDVRSLEGSLNKLLFYSIMHHANVIDMKLLLDAFKDDNIIKNPRSTLTKEIILKTTAEFYYLTTTQLISKNKTQKLATPREISMYLMRELLDVTFSEIGHYFSGRDHSTIMKACSRVENKMNDDKDYRLAVNKLKNQLATNKS